MKSPYASIYIQDDQLTVIPNLDFSGILEVVITVSDGVATDQDSFSIYVYKLGCTGESSCNYDPLANVDDGSCIYPDYGYECYQDCAGIWNGDAIRDDCGVCNGDNTSCEIMGDSNGDGQINIVDVVLVINLIVYHLIKF